MRDLASLNQASLEKTLESYDSSSNRSKFAYYSLSEYAMKTFPTGLLIFCLSFSSAIAYESMHEKTPVGEIKVIRLPERVALEAKKRRFVFLGKQWFVQNFVPLHKSK